MKSFLLLFPVSCKTGKKAISRPHAHSSAKMATSRVVSSLGAHPEVRTEFSTKEGWYRNVKASEHCRPSKQPLFGKELSPVQVSFVSCKDKDGLLEWILFNSGKELYFYPFDGVGKVGACVTAVVT